MLVITILIGACGFASSAVSEDYIYSVASILVALGYGFYDTFTTT